MTAKSIEYPVYIHGEGTYVYVIQDGKAHFPAKDSRDCTFCYVYLYGHAK